MNLTDFLTFPRYDRRNANAINKFITAETTTEEFSKKLEKYPSYTLNSGGSKNKTALSTAASVGNVKLIEYIVNRGGKSLLYIGSDGWISPLHYACACEDPEKGYETAKKLLQLGTPVNITRKRPKKDGSYSTALETALWNQRTRIATLFLRVGGIGSVVIDGEVMPQMQETLDAAKKDIMTDNEKLFSLGEGPQSLPFVVPKKVVDYILCISSKLV